MYIYIYMSRCQIGPLTLWHVAAETLGGTPFYVAAPTARCGPGVTQAVSRNPTGDGSGSAARACRLTLFLIFRNF